MVQGIGGYRALLEDVDVRGPFYEIYAYRPQASEPPDSAWLFLSALKQKDLARYSKYLVTIRRLGMSGQARFEDWHMLDPKKPPKGLAHDAKLLKNIGELKNIGHKSRIFHYREERRLILLTAYEGKKEDKLTADSVNPALDLLKRFFHERESLLHKVGGRKSS